ncbi:MAG: hypothetical protein KF855_17530 [Acidobacteria bacterium]|nr:hypothetical protein [Acidobacteriota bacterium]
MNKEITEQPRSKTLAWVKRLGFWGFMFFTIKGLLWLIVPAAIAYFSCG